MVGAAQLIVDQAPDAVVEHGRRAEVSRVHLKRARVSIDDGTET